MIVRRSMTLERYVLLEMTVSASATTEMALVKTIFAKLLFPPRSSKSDQNSDAVGAMENVINRTPMPMAAHAPIAIAV